MNGFLLKFLTGSARVNMKRPCRKFPQTFGISKSSVSRKFIHSSARQLRQLHERDLSDQEIIAIFMDGKSFAENQMILALEMTLQRRKDRFRHGRIPHRKPPGLSSFSSKAQRERAERWKQTPFYYWWNQKIEKRDSQCVWQTSAGAALPVA